MKTHRSFLLSLILLVGCAEPYHVTEIGDDVHFRQSQSSAVSDGRLSRQSLQYLSQHSLQDAYQRSAREAIDGLLAKLAKYPSRPAAYVLAELCFMEGSRLRPASDESLRYYLSSAMFAYAFMFDDHLPGYCNPFDRRYRIACETYNRALSKILACRPLLGSDWKNAATMESIVGPVKFVEQKWKLSWPPNLYDRFTTAYPFSVSGIDFPSRQEGLGVPLISYRSPSASQSKEIVDAFLPSLSCQAFASTMCVRFHGSIAAAAQKNGTPLTADVSVLDPMVEGSLMINGRSVPIEADFTTPLACAIENAPHVSGFKGFMDTTSWGDRRGLYLIHPFQRGKIPVVFVNGLMGKPMTWVPMFNDLISNETLRARYQFWYFMYPTGNPLLYSAAVLRGELQKAKRAFDPDGSDPAFNQMVIVGHSMGGLVTRLQVTNSGNEIWKAVTNRPFESLGLSESLRDLVGSVFFFESLPFVKRVVFMATPHRGSALADKWFAKIFSADVKLPEQILLAIDQLHLSTSSTNKADGIVLAPTAVESLSAGNPVLIAFDRLPIAPGVKYNSIIANHRTAGQSGGTDTIVPYTSAHIDGASSETIILSGHSCTRNPNAIHEVEQILLTHLAELDDGSTQVSKPPSLR